MQQTLVNWDFKPDDDEDYINANERSYYNHISVEADISFDISQLQCNDMSSH